MFPVELLPLSSACLLYSCHHYNNICCITPAPPPPHPPSCPRHANITVCPVGLLHFLFGFSFPGEKCSSSGQKENFQPGILRGNSFQWKNLAESPVLVTWRVSRCAIKLIKGCGCLQVRGLEWVFWSQILKPNKSVWVHLEYDFETLRRAITESSFPFCLSFVLTSPSVIAVPHSSSCISFSEVSVSTGLLVCCVFHVQKEPLCGQRFHPGWS